MPVEDHVVLGGANSDVVRDEALVVSRELLNHGRVLPGDRVYQLDELPPVVVHVMPAATADTRQPFVRNT